VFIVDIGVAADFDPSLPGLLHRKVARGTRNMAGGPAMTGEEAEKALTCGMDVMTQIAKKVLIWLLQGTWVSATLRRHRQLRL